MKINGIYRFAALILGLIYAGFFILMSLDSIPFEWNSKEIGGFLLHVSPGIIIFLGAIIGFKKPFIGFIIFILITIATTLFFHTYRNGSNFLVISFPALIVALLLFISLDRKR